MRKHVVSFALSFFLFSILSAQSITPHVINSSGGTYKVPSQNYYLDWSVAEMTLVNTMSHPAPHHGLYVITNGYLQPDKKEEGDDKREQTSNFTANEIKVYPNPAVNHVEVKFYAGPSGHVRLTLFNVSGLIVYTKLISLYGKGSIERIPLANLTAGTYMLNVQMEDGANGKQGSFKIVKMY